MNAEWQNFLIKTGANFDNSTLLDFGAIERERKFVGSGTIISALTSQCVLKISGDDAAEFLNHQLSNNVTELTDNISQYNSFSTHKGRVIVNFILYKQNDAFFAIIPENIVEKIKKRLQMFVMRSAVVLEIMPDLVAIELYGQNSANYFSQTNLELPNNIFEQTYNDLGSTVIKIIGINDRYIIVANYVQMQDIWQKLDVNCALIGELAWKLLDIKAGIAKIDNETSEVFIHHMLNLQEVPMVSFTKGCYPGQEVVARMQYLGKNKRKMYRVIIDRDSAILAGEQLNSASVNSTKGAGQIVQSAINSDGQVEALAVLHEDAIAADDVVDLLNNKTNISQLYYK